MSKITKTIIISAALLLVIVFTAVFLYFVPRTYVSIDVNPSIELNLNMYGYVVDAHALNDDGQEILDQLDLNGKNYENVLKLILEQMENDGYIENDEEVFIVMAVGSSSEILLGSIYYKSNLILDDYDGDIKVAIVDEDDIEDAHVLNITAGRFELIKKSLKKNEQYNLYDIVDKSLQELFQYIRIENSEGIDGFEELIDAISGASAANEGEVDTVSGASATADEGVDTVSGATVPADEGVDTVSGASADSGSGVDTVTGASAYYDDDDDEYEDDDEHEDEDEYEDEHEDDDDEYDDD